MRIVETNIYERQASMAITLVHEVAHTFGMGDVYDNEGHDVDDGYECVMELIETEYASGYYMDLLLNRNGATPFCDSCMETLQPLVPKKLHKGN